MYQPRHNTDEAYEVILSALLPLCYDRTKAERLARLFSKATVTRLASESYDVSHIAEAMHYLLTTQGLDWKTVTPNRYAQAAAPHLKEYLRTRYPRPVKTYKQRFTPINEFCRLLAEEMRLLGNGYFKQVIDEQWSDIALSTPYSKRNSQEDMETRWCTALANCIFCHLRLTAHQLELIPTIRWGLEYINQDPTLSYHRLKFYAYGIPGKHKLLSTQDYVRMIIMPLTRYINEAIDCPVNLIRDSINAETGINPAIAYSIAKVVIKRINQEWEKTGVVPSDKTIEALPGVVVDQLLWNIEAGVEPPTLLLKVADYVEETELVVHILEALS